MSEETEKLVDSSYSHWYFPNGQPCHEVPYAASNKAKAGQFRATTVGDARKMGLLPSVTNIIRVLDKPVINDWRVEQAILSAITLPRGADELVDDFAARVVRDADAQRDKAADFGTRVHKATEYIHKTGLYPEDLDADIQPQVYEYFLWFRENVQEVYFAEKVLVNTRRGYAGTVDLFAKFKGIGKGILDTKTQGFRDGKVVFYPEWHLQMVAYGDCDEIVCESDEIKMISLAINSKAAQAPEIKVWDGNEAAFEAFDHCFGVWRYLKAYNPLPKVVI